MNKLGIWAIAVAGAFILGILSANPTVEAVGGWQAAIADLVLQISSNDADISDHETRITNLENQPVGTQLYTKTTEFTGIGSGVTLSFEDFCDSGDTVVNGYFKDFQGGIDQTSTIQTNAIESGGQEGYKVRMNTAGPTQDYKGIIVCADTNP